MLRRRARNRRKAVSAFWGAALKTYVYVDGFNLYYRALKRTPYRWLDLNSLMNRVFPHNDIGLIRYFTAKVRPLPHDPDQRTRQEVYLRALNTLQNLTIHFGHFTAHEVDLPLAKTIGSATKFARVLRSEEKGSDVNLAAHLVNDAHKNAFEVAIVVTNDSDLVEPIRLVTTEVGLRVGILNPCKQPAGGLKSVASFYRVLRKNVLGKAQFPPRLTDGRGTFSKPAAW